jgi:hypothetical protein
LSDVRSRPRTQVANPDTPMSLWELFGQEVLESSPHPPGTDGRNGADGSGGGAASTPTSRSGTSTSLCLGSVGEVVAVSSVVLACLTVEDYAAAVAAARAELPESAKLVYSLLKPRTNRSAKELSELAGACVCGRAGARVRGQLITACA